MFWPFIRIYNKFIRPHTPRKIASFNGVPVRGVHLLDVTDEFPKYEEPLLDAIRNRVQQNDDIVIVGGGNGVSSVVAARQAAPNGHVTTYEAGDERLDIARETAELGCVSNRITIEHAIVGSDIGVVGDSSDAAVVPSSDLPKCQTLVLDCEGAELEILKMLDQRPRTIVVETHGFLDAPESAVRDHLDELEYDVVDRSVELEEKGVYVLTAINPEDE